MHHRYRIFADWRKGATHAKSKNRAITARAATTALKECTIDEPIKSLEREKIIYKRKQSQKHESTFEFLTHLDEQGIGPVSWIECLIISDLGTVLYLLMES